MNKFLIFGLVGVIFLGAGWHFVSSSAKTLQSKVPSTIVFVPGLDIDPENYTSLISTLRSQKYLVKVYEPTYENRENDSLMVDTWTKEIQQKIGNERVIIVGHSVGGAVAAHFCSIDKRCIGGVNMDGGGVHDETLSHPFLYIQGGIGSYCDEECITERSRMETITKQSHTNILQIPSARHFDFTDLRAKELSDQGYLGTSDITKLVQDRIVTFLGPLRSYSD